MCGQVLVLLKELEVGTAIACVRTDAEGVVAYHGELVVGEVEILPLDGVVAGSVDGAREG